MSFDLAGTVGAQAIFGRAAEAADDVDGLRTQLDLGGHLQGALPVNDLQRSTSLGILYHNEPSAKCHIKKASLIRLSTLFTASLQKRLQHNWVQDYVQV